ncbi:hypothetical protein MNBD_GAMMA21-1134 [hydrothermal vent metagenome]|uniref:DUF4124 domain-containing protein n=1 Tax=hydrothermal vent metagenome TaxID=652676 RepID=A0A3B1ART1_9ZZZZ
MAIRSKLINLVILILLLAIQNTAQAKLIKCWQNKAGVRECGSAVPPEYSQTRIEFINERGLIVKVVEAAKTPQELAAERERKHIMKEQEDLRKEQARLDSILLNTYTTERDLLLARDNNLKAAQGQIDISRGNLKLLQSNFDDLQNQAANFERTGKQPPSHLIVKLDKARELVKQKKIHIESKEVSKNEMLEKFKRDLTRFKELKRGRIN